MIYINENKNFFYFSIILIAVAAFLTVLVVVVNVFTFPTFINIEEKIITDLNIFLEKENNEVSFLILYLKIIRFIMNMV